MQASRVVSAVDCLTAILVPDAISFPIKLYCTVLIAIASFEKTLPTDVPITTSLPLAPIPTSIVKFRLEATAASERDGNSIIAE